MKCYQMIKEERVKSFPLSNVKITNSSTPLSKPNVRGGVYFSDTFVFKIVGTTDVCNDWNIITSQIVFCGIYFR